MNIRTTSLLYISADLENLKRVTKIASKWSDGIVNPFYFVPTIVEAPFQIYSKIRESLKDSGSNLSVLIDYKSFIMNSKKWQEYSTVLRDCILCFPELNFYFDERDRSDKNESITDFLDYIVTGIGLTKNGLNIEDVIKDIHIFKSEIHERNKIIDMAESPFNLLLKGRDNLFDASNLRFVLKKMRYKELSLHENYGSVQKSRKENLALCIEEERSQSLFNSIALFLNGFRVLPITCAEELQWANCNLKPSIIIRDYDLQFSDGADKRKRQRGAKTATVSQFENIYLIRGWHCNKTNKKWEKTIDNNNVYWSNLNNAPIFYVSKGSQNDEGKRNMFFHIFNTDDDSKQQEIKGDNSSQLFLPGIDKPVSGVYKPFQAINIIRRRYNDSFQPEDTIFTNRTQEDGHGVPLDIYNVVKDMVDRAELYYNNGRFVHSVVVANEAIEIMNGFHQSLTIRAYRCQVMAENALAANILGGDENELRNDTEFRLEKIEKDITRISSVGDHEDALNINKKKNMLNQIFNDIRIYCQEREHFEAEDAVVRAIGHLNEGFPLSVFKNFLLETIKRHRHE